MDRGSRILFLKLLCTIGDAVPQEIFYGPKKLVSRKHPKWIDSQMMESKKIFCSYVPEDGA